MAIGKKLVRREASQALPALTPLMSRLFTARGITDVAELDHSLAGLVPPERQMENEELRMKKSKGTQKKRKIQMSKDFVNVVKE